jgi:hypothetical protein
MVSALLRDSDRYSLSNGSRASEVFPSYRVCGTTSLRSLYVFSAYLRWCLIIRVTNHHCNHRNSIVETAYWVGRS